MGIEIYIDDDFKHVVIVQVLNGRRVRREYELIEEVEE